MHRLVALALLSVSSAHAAPPLCALAAPASTASSVQDAPVPVIHLAADKASGSFDPVQPDQSVPDALLALPFVKHISASGATILDLGTSHGLHSMVARSGDQFMLFQVTPDGGAAVSGALTELTASQLSMLAGGTMVELGTLHGLRGFYVRSGPQFQIFYATPDEQRLIPGVLWDASGLDLTKGQVANIPGAIPTVVVGDAPPSATGTPAITAPALPLVQKAASGTVGPASAPHLWMLIDPQCIYSVRAYQALQPYVASGKLQLSVIPLSVLDYEDGGQSTRSALALLSKPAESLVTAWQAGDVAGPPSPDAAARLQGNMAVSHAIGLTGTPTFIWRKPDGSEGRLDGMPSSVDSLVSSIGG
jgi:thiol:disulfide interchange protein DsbG